MSVSRWVVLGGGGAATGPNWWISLRFISNLTGETTTKGYKMPAADPKTQKHFTFKDEEVNNASAKSKVRTRVDCNHCNALRVLDGSWAVFSNLDRLRCHLPGDQDICRIGIKGKGNGGIGPCPNVPEEVAEEFVVQVRTRQQQISRPRTCALAFPGLRTWALAITWALAGLLARPGPRPHIQALVPWLAPLSTHGPWLPLVSSYACARNTPWPTRVPMWALARPLRRVGAGGRVCGAEGPHAPRPTAPPAVQLPLGPQPRSPCAHWGCWSHIIKLSSTLKFS